MAKKKASKNELDLNNDGKFDSKDKSIAAKVLATSLNKESELVEEKAEEVKSEGRIAKKDISLTYRKGSLVPESQIEIWKKSKINYEVWF